MIKNIVFDIGQVIIHFEPVLQPLQIFDDLEDIAKYSKWVYLSPHWIELDRQIWTMEELVDRIVADAADSDVALDPKIVRTLIEDNIDYCFYLNKPTIAVIDLLRRVGDWKMYLLSNFHGDFYRKTKERYPIFQTFDGEIISGDEHLVKPDPAIYQRLMDKYDLKPEECVFIDDRDVNVQAAIDFGMHGIHYTNSSKYIELFDLLENGMAQKEEVRRD